VRQTVTIINKLGLHARAAARLVQTAGGFSSQIMLLRDGREVNAKSIMGVMMLAAGKGTELEVDVSGEDEAEAMAAITGLIESRFGEPE
jgi:phosphocarrier protein HPr